ncbi:MAG: class I SAM-dependent rRNA methyltransferase [Elusimicrobia bacterium]|nr:class I SAM-dependent rRNA methyltransferase [Candidatus Obscuribacterium magneticum]
MDQKDLLVVDISQRARKKLEEGGLWIFSNEVAMTKPFPEPGTWCWFQCQGEVAGTGYFNPHSLIAGRVVSLAKTSDIQALLRHRLEAAFRRRLRLQREGSVRLVFSEADFLPGLVIDWYSEVAVMKSNTAGIDRVLPELEILVPKVLKEVFHVDLKALVVRADSSIRQLEKVETFSRIVFGEESLVRNGVATEGSVHYAADFLEGQKTGFFLDQRDNRWFMTTLVPEPERRLVLDLFSYSGGWGLLELKKGADHVTFVDESREAMRLIERGLALNKIQSHRARLVCEDVFDFLEKDKDLYDVVIADPPAFMRSKKDHPRGMKAYEKLNRLAWRRLREEGMLVSCSCSYHLSESDFVEVLSRAVAKEKGVAHIIYRGRQAGDHPVLLSMPETYYLKCIGLKKLKVNDTELDKVSPSPDG